MKEKYISLNFKHLQSKEHLSKDDFGYKFGLKRGIFAHFCRTNKCNNTDFLIKLAQYYNVKVEDLVYTDISKTLTDSNYYVKESQAKYVLSPEEKLEELEKKIKQLEKDKRELLSVINIFKQQSELIIYQKKQLAILKKDEK